MNIALSKSEIARFLESGPARVQMLWDNNVLKRSIYVDYRYNPELSHSSIFDVLEYYLRTEVLEENEPDTELEAWLCAVDEFVESGGWSAQPLDDMVFSLMELYSDFSGAPCQPSDMAQRASKTLAAYLCLTRFVEHDSPSPTTPYTQASGWV